MFLWDRGENEENYTIKQQQQNESVLEGFSVKVVKMKSFLLQGELHLFGPQLLCSSVTLTKPNFAVSRTPRCHSGHSVVGFLSPDPAHTEDEPRTCRGRTIHVALLLNA